MGRFSRAANLFFYGIAALLVVIAACGAYYFYVQNRDIYKGQAERSLERARSLTVRLGRRELSPSQARELKEARDHLRSASAAHGRRAYRQAFDEANAALEELEGIQDGLEAPRENALCLAVAESVKIVAKDGTGRGELQEGAYLTPGDAIEAGSSGEAMVRFPNLEELTLLPGAKVRLDTWTAGAAGSGVQVRLERGAILFRTPALVPAGGAGLILLPRGSVRSAPGAVARIGVGANEGFQVEARRGVIQVETAGSRETLDARSGALAVEGGSNGMTPPRSLQTPPLMALPVDGAVLRSRGGRSGEVTLEWQNLLGASVNLQIAKDPLFRKGMVVDRSVTGGSFTSPALPEGMYYWRLRAERGGLPSFWSQPSRFRVLRAAEGPAPPDWLLTVDATPVGDGVLINGKVTPGLFVTVNDVEVNVGQDGTFSGVFTFAGAKDRTVTVTAFDGQGHEKVWKRTF